MDPEDRPQNFLPQKYDALRKVPGYANFVQEKFERCLDLYLCPRQRKIRVNLSYIRISVKVCIVFGLNLVYRLLKVEYLIYVDFWL